jgi:quinol monooxygenase YgiN
MSTAGTSPEGKYVHIVTLKCRDADHARHCLAALANYGRPDAQSYRCVSYEFGLKNGTSDTVLLIERWRRWEDLDALLTEKVVPALPTYNQLLEAPFDPATDTVRIELVGG